MPKEKIKFNEETHEYTLGRKKLISVTQLMKKYGLAPDYDEVNPDTLMRKAKRGKLIHKEIDDYNKFGTMGFTKEVGLYADYIKKNNIKVLASELTVYNDVVAGTLDILLEENNKIFTTDNKTTYQIHHEAVGWQTSIYTYLLLDMIKKDIITIEGISKDITYEELCGRVLHFKDETLTPKDIPFKPYEEVDKLMEAERTNGEFKPIQLNIEEQQLAALISLENYLKTLKKQQEDTEAKQKEIKEALLNAMEKGGYKTFENEHIKITYTPPGTKTSLDQTLLKEKAPKTYAKYLKTTPTKASLRITIRDEKKNERSKVDKNNN